MKGFSWLHVSDIHFRPDNDWKDNQPRQKLLETLESEFTEKRTPKVDAIFCTGDIAYGELSTSPLKEQYESARVFFDELRSVCKVAADRLFIVPGNHDIDRGAINGMAHTTLQNWADNSHEHWGRMNAEFARQTADIKSHLKKLDQYVDFAQSYAPHCVGRGKSAHYAHVFEHENLRIAVAGLNSAWACSGSEKGDKDRVWIAAKAQLDSIAAQTKDVDLRIALMHHPLDWLPQADKSWAEQRLSSDYDFFLHGHTHDLTVTAGQSLFTIRSGATCADTPVEFGFNMVHIDYGRKKVSARGWVYVDHHNQWESRTLGNQRNFRNGANSFHFKPGFKVPKLGIRPPFATAESVPSALASVPEKIDPPNSLVSQALPNHGVPLDPRQAALETINAHTEAGRARLNGLITSGSPYTGVVTEGTEVVQRPVLRAVERLEEALSTGQPLRLPVRGALGAGRLQFLLLVYVALQERGHHCLFIDLDSAAVRPDEIDARVSAASKTPGKAIALVYESGQSRPNSDVWRIIDLLGALPTVDASLSDPGGTSWKIGLGSDREAVARAYIDLVRDITPVKVSTEVLYRGYVKRCDQHRLMPDFYSARLFCRNPNMPYGLAMKEQLERRIVGLSEFKTAAKKRSIPDEPKARTNFAKTVLIEVAEYAFARDTLDEGKARSRAQEFIPEIHETLCAQSEHVSPMLSALGQVSALKVLFEATKTSKTPDLKTHRRELHELDYVQTCTINVFVKEIINKWDDYRVEAADGLLRLLRIDEGSAYLLKFKANICYILGRIDRTQDHNAIASALGKLIENVKSQARFIELAKQVVGALAGLDPKSTHLLNSATKAFSVMLDENGLDKNDLSIVQLTRLERRCMLLTRSAYISLAMLGEKDRATEYVRRVLSSPLENDLNRGFHRAYFLDIKGERADPLLDTDSDLGTCDATVDALLKALATRPDPAMATVQALTLGCLVRARLNPLDPSESVRTATPEQRHEVASAISSFLADQGNFLPSDIRLALAQLTREIQFGKWVLEKMVDDLFALKFQRRVGWGAVSRPESVASHSMFVQFLAAMFGRERQQGQLEQELPDSFPLYHDLGEAVVSDIPYPQKGEKTSREEKSVVQSIGLMGLACGVERMAKLPEHFGSFESAKSGAHNDKDDSVAFYNDMDRLELLIQFYRYVREGEKMEREAEFRKHVQPENFLTTQGKSLADRFTRYFQSTDAQLATTSETLTVWPIPQKLVLVDKIGQFTG